ncbi:MAG TPA: M28 family peptidase, partial [Gemmatimonadetes bacterium]|nr:M28 family peptidase [Gemmatimonadota bacterium]
GDRRPECLQFLYEGGLSLSGLVQRFDAEDGDLLTDGTVSDQSSPEYARMHADEDHVLAMESDGGVFKPLGYGFTGSDAAFEMVSEIGTLLDRIGSGRITRGGGGADIGPLMRTGVPGMGFSVDGTRYFWYHHTDADTLDKLDPDEVALCVATFAVMAYIVADMPTRLPR